MDHEKIGKARNRHPEIAIKALVPSFFQRNTTPTLRIKSQQCSADGVEAGGEHEHIERIFSLRSDHSGRIDLANRGFAQVDQLDVIAIKSFVIAVVDNWRLVPI